MTLTKLIKLSPLSLILLSTTAAMSADATTDNQIEKLLLESSNSPSGIIFIEADGAIINIDDTGVDDVSNNDVSKDNVTKDVEIQNDSNYVANNTSTDATNDENITSDENVTSDDAIVNEPIIVIPPTDEELSYQDTNQLENTGQDEQISLYYETTNNEVQNVNSTTYEVGEPEVLVIKSIENIEIPVDATKNELREALREEIREEVRAELREEIGDELREELREELLYEVIEQNVLDNNQSIASESNDAIEKVSLVTVNYPVDSQDTEEDAQSHVIDETFESPNSINKINSSSSLNNDTNVNIASNQNSEVNNDLTTSPDPSAVTNTATSDPAVNLTINKTFHPIKEDDSTDTSDSTQIETPVNAQDTVVDTSPLYHSRLNSIDKSMPNTSTSTSTPSQTFVSQFPEQPVASLDESILTQTVQINYINVDMSIDNSNPIPTTPALPIITKNSPIYTNLINQNATSSSTDITEGDLEPLAVKDASNLSSAHNAVEIAPAYTVLPNSFNTTISMPTISYNLSQFLDSIATLSNVDIVLAKEVNNDQIVNIASTRQVQIKTLFNRTLHQNNLTYKMIGENLIFVYEDNEYSNCIYNAINTEKALSATASNNYSFDSPDTVSINTTDLSLSKTLNFISGLTNRNIYIHNDLTLPNTMGNFNTINDTLNLKHKNLNQILTVLSYRNRIAYQYVDDDVILITEDINLNACSDSAE